MSMEILIKIFNSGPTDKLVADLPCTLHDVQIILLFHFPNLI